jgi:hypothetical protein
MKTEEILHKLSKTINFFIDHKDNKENTPFGYNVNRLINIKAELHKANDAERSYDKCHI